jgi:hypothetical protein
MSVTTSATQKALDCPSWCVADHAAGPVGWERRIPIRTHFGHSQEIAGVDLGDDETVATAELVRVDDLDTGTSREVGVAAWCDGVMTVEQAFAFARAVLRAATLAQEARRGPLVVEGDTDHGR